MRVFTGTLVAAAVAFGCLANRPPEVVPGPAAPATETPHPGEALFASYCTGCHTLDEAVFFARAAADIDTARREFTALLASHGDSSAAEDALIVDFVMSQR
jgi:mono/diheme cytochrome c family protein